MCSLIVVFAGLLDQLLQKSLVCWDVDQTADVLVDWDPYYFHKHSGHFFLVMAQTYQYLVNGYTSKGVSPTWKYRALVWKWATIHHENMPI